MGHLYVLLGRDIAARSRSNVSFLVDNFEWLSGSSVKFGLQYTNYTSLERIPKASMFQVLNWFT